MKITLVLTKNKSSQYLARVLPFLLLFSQLEERERDRKGSERVGKREKASITLALLVLDKLRKKAANGGYVVTFWIGMRVNVYYIHLIVRCITTEIDPCGIRKQMVVVICRFTHIYCFARFLFIGFDFLSVFFFFFA